MKRRTTRRRTDRLAALRIDVGLILLQRLGIETFRNELIGNGVAPETIIRVLSMSAKRRPVFQDEDNRPRRSSISDTSPTMLRIKNWLSCR